jgi:hypothetical protein
MRSVRPTDTDIALADLDAMPDTMQNYRRRKTTNRGRKKSIVHFRGNKEIHMTARGAYIALIEHFTDVSSAPLNDPRVTKGSKRNYFSRNKDNLFLHSPHLLNNPNNWTKLKNGCYAITNLSATENFKNLCRYANACGLKHGKDWDFEPLDPTEETSNARRREQLDQEIFADLDAMEGNV